MAQPPVHRVTSYAEAEAALDAVVAACLAGDGRDPLDEAARLQLRHHGLDEAELWLAGDAGFALARHAGGSTHLELAVAPDHRGRDIGHSLAAAALAGTRGEVLAWSHGDHPGAAALADRLGFTRARELHVMTRPLSTADATAQVDPRIRGYRPTDAEALLRVNAAAFADHPEQGALDAAGLAERMAEPWFDPAGLLVADDGVGPDLLGFHWTKVHGDGSGEVYVLGVAPSAQGTGLGRLLTAAGLRHLAARGCPRVHLYVEGTNHAALALYGSAGFTPDHLHVQYRRP